MNKADYLSVDNFLRSAKAIIEIDKKEESDKATVQLYEQLEMRIQSAINLNKHIYSME